MIAINNSFFNFSQYTIMISGPTWFFKGRDNNFLVISCHLYFKKNFRGNEGSTILQI